MKLSAAALLVLSGSTHAFVISPVASNCAVRSDTSIQAEIRPKTEKAQVLEFGWDGTTALGGAVDDSKPARMLDAIRESGETQSSVCELFNANLGEFNYWISHFSCFLFMRQLIFLVLFFIRDDWR